MDVNLELDTMMKSDKHRDEMFKLTVVPDHQGYKFDEYETKAGATVNATLITSTHIYCANAGDSRSVLSCGKAAAELSEDHKPQNKHERARIEAARGIVNNNRVQNKISTSRALGDFEFKQASNLQPDRQMITAYPDITVTEITRDTEFIVLACDGIWDVHNSQWVVDFIHDHVYEKNFDGRRSKCELKGGFEDLFEECCAKEITEENIGTDNMTAILVEL